MSAIPPSGGGQLLERHPGLLQDGLSTKGGLGQIATPLQSTWVAAHVTQAVFDKDGL